MVASKVAAFGCAGPTASSGRRLGSVLASLFAIISLGLAIGACGVYSPHDFGNGRCSDYNPALCYGMGNENSCCVVNERGCKVCCMPCYGAAGRYGAPVR